MTKLLLPFLFLVASVAAAQDAPPAPAAAAAKDAEADAAAEAKDAEADAAAEAKDAAAEVDDAKDVGGDAKDVAAPTAPSATPTADMLRTADEAYQLKVRQLETDLNELKERIFRSKAKLTLLTEQVTGGAGTGASAVISHQWEMGSAFRLAEVHYFIDGAPIWQDVDETGTRLSQVEHKQIFDGNLVEGSHTISVKMVLKGNGSGVFSYVDNFTWTIQDKYTFTAEPGKVHNIVVVAFEKGGFTTELKDRPSLRFDVEVQADKESKKDTAKP